MDKAEGDTKQTTGEKGREYEDEKEEKKKAKKAKKKAKKGKSDKKKKKSNKKKETVKEEDEGHGSELEVIPEEGDEENEWNAFKSEETSHAGSSDALDVILEDKEPTDDIPYEDEAPTSDIPYDETGSLGNTPRGSEDEMTFNDLVEDPSKMKTLRRSSEELIKEKFSKKDWISPEDATDKGQEEEADLNAVTEIGPLERFARMSNVGELLEQAESSALYPSPEWSRPTVRAALFLVDEDERPDNIPLGSEFLKSMDRNVMKGVLVQFSSMPMERIHHFALNGEFMHALYKDKKLVDVLIHIDDRIFYAHRNILCAHSDYFAGTLMNNDIPPFTVTDITLKNIDPQLFKRFLHFAYTGDVFVNLQNVQELKRLGHMLQSPTLLAKLMIFLSKMNAMEFQEAMDILTQRLDSDEKPIAIEVVKNNFSAVMKDVDSLCHFGAEDMLDIISADNLCVNSELDVFWAVLFWVAWKPANRINSLDKLMSQVRFTRMSSLELLDCARVSELVRLSKLCKKMLLTANWVCHARETGLEDPLRLPLQAQRVCLIGGPKYEPTVAEFDSRFLKYKSLMQQEGNLLLPAVDEDVFTQKVSFDKKPDIIIQNEFDRSPSPTALWQNERTISRAFLPPTNMLYILDFAPEKAVSFEDTGQPVTRQREYIRSSRPPSSQEYLLSPSKRTNASQTELEHVFTSKPSQDYLLSSKQGWRGSSRPTKDHELVSRRPGSPSYLLSPRHRHKLYQSSSPPSKSKYAYLYSPDFSSMQSPEAPRSKYNLLSPSLLKPVGPKRFASAPQPQPPSRYPEKSKGPHTPQTFSAPSSVRISRFDGWQMGAQPEFSRDSFIDYGFSQTPPGMSQLYQNEYDYDPKSPRPSDPIGLYRGSQTLYGPPIASSGFPKEQVRPSYDFSPRQGGLLQLPGEAIPSSDYPSGQQVRPPSAFPPENVRPGFIQRTEERMAGPSSGYPQGQVRRSSAFLPENVSSDYPSGQQVRAPSAFPPENVRPGFIQRTEEGMAGPSSGYPQGQVRRSSAFPPENVRPGFIQRTEEGVAGPSSGYPQGQVRRSSAFPPENVRSGFIQRTEEGMAGPSSGYPQGQVRRSSALPPENVRPGFIQRTEEGMAGPSSGYPQGQVIRSSAFPPENVRSGFIQLTDEGRVGPSTEYPQRQARLSSAISQDKIQTSYAFLNLPKYFPPQVQGEGNVSDNRMPDPTQPSQFSLVPRQGHVGFRALSQNPEAYSFFPPSLSPTAVFTQDNQINPTKEIATNALYDGVRASDSDLFPRNILKETENILYARKELDRGSSQGKTPGNEAAEFAASMVSCKISVIDHQHKFTDGNANATREQGLTTSSYHNQNNNVSFLKHFDRKSISASRMFAVSNEINLNGKKTGAKPKVKKAKEISATNIPLRLENKTVKIVKKTKEDKAGGSSSDNSYPEERDSSPNNFFEHDSQFHVHSKMDPLKLWESCACNVAERLLLNDTILIPEKVQKVVLTRGKINEDERNNYPASKQT